VEQFIESCHRKGVRPAIYYIAGTNVYCNVKGGVVQPPGGPCGNQDDYNSLVLGQLKEVWTNYGNLTEIWFDGGVPASQKDALAELYNATQPTAAVFGAYGLKIRNPVRWVGSETGHTPSPDNWDTTSPHAGQYHDGNGGGVANGSDWVPAECDVTLQANGVWYWGPGNVSAPRSIGELESIYEDSVGHNCNLQLGFHPNYDGNIPAKHGALYKQFGDWIRTCYSSSPLNETRGSLRQGESLILELPNNDPEGAPAPNRAVLMEDVSQGQRVRSWRLDALTAGGRQWGSVAAGESIGHKRIVPMTGLNGTVSALRLTVVANAESPAQILSFSARKCSLAPRDHGKCSTTPGVKRTGIVLATLTGTRAACCSACWDRSALCVAFNLMGTVCELLSTEGGQVPAAGAITGEKKV
jgi:alpha-L-fucosidase